MGSAATCCTNLVPHEAIRGKDEIISRYSIGNNKLNNLNNNNNINELDSKSNSNDDSNNNKIQQSFKQPPNILEIENKYNINNNNNNNMNSISSTYHNNKQNYNPSQNSQKIKNIIFEE